MDYRGRKKKLAARMDAEGLDALFISNLTNIRYLCGFTGSNAFLLVSGSGSWFFSDGRYATQAAQEVEDAEVSICSTHSEVSDALRSQSAGLERVGFEAANVTVGKVGKGWSLPPSLGQVEGYFEKAELVPAPGWVEEIRKVKEPAEVELIQEAARMADEGLRYIVERVQPGRTERELALDLEFYLRRSGADDVSFDLIVAAAERSALPHARPTDRAVEQGRFLLFDLGCIYQGYCSDITRTFVVGPCDDRHREVYAAVLAAQVAGVEAVRAGATGDEADAASRGVLAAAGLARHFTHGLGHGVGLEIHEAPTLRKEVAEPLEPGNVVTVEPGAYLEGWGGVRIEDLLVVERQRARVLSTFPKELTVL